MMSCFHGVTIGFIGGSVSRGRPNATIAPNNLPLYFRSSSGLVMGTPMTLPLSVPFVLGDQPAAASVSSCTDGEIVFPQAPVPCPRVQLLAIFQGSWWTFERPMALNCSAAHSLAFFSSGEPVRRGPMLSVR